MEISKALTLHLYTLGSLAAADRGADLYDVNAQAVLAAARVPQAAGIRYLPLYPPQVSLFLAPPAHLHTAGRSLCGGFAAHCSTLIVTAFATCA